VAAATITFEESGPVEIDVRARQRRPCSASRVHVVVEPGPDVLGAITAVESQ
jgi:hypothetical protein